MKNLKFCICVLLALAILAGCATTKFDVISKPGTDLTKCDNILVCSDLEDAVFKADLETRFVDNFAKHNKKAAEGTNAKSDSGFDYIMDVKLLSSSLKLDHKKIGPAFPVSFKLEIGESHEVTEKVVMSFDISVTDTKTNEMIFRGTVTSDTEESTEAGCVNAIFSSVASSTVKKYFAK
ncbi:MAG: hypothetical protein J6W62_07730 [Spirochaetia bacterium]|nr:hypothetical protein [Spirochaetia bacterium]